MSVSVELQTAVYARLVADAGVAAIVGARVYDGPPADPAYPYISFGPSDSFEDDEECIAARVETMQIDCWSRAQNRRRPCKALVDAVKAALHDAPLELATQALHSIRVVRAQVMSSPDDALAAHGVVTVEALLEEV